MVGLQIRYDIVGLEGDMAIYEMTGLKRIDGLDIRHGITVFVRYIKHFMDLMKYLLDFDEAFDIFRMKI